MHPQPAAIGMERFAVPADWAQRATQRNRTEPFRVQFELPIVPDVSAGLMHAASAASASRVRRIGRRLDPLSGRDQLTPFPGKRESEISRAWSPRGDLGERKLSFMPVAPDPEARRRARDRQQDALDEP